MFSFIAGITDSIQGIYSNVYDSVFGFLRNGVERYFNTLKVQTTTAGLTDYFTHLEYTESTLNSLIFAIKLGVIVGTVVAIVTVFGNLFLILIDYKKRVLDARKGIFKFRKTKISISMHAGLAGAIISNSIFMFFVIIFTLTIVFSFLAWPLFWKILWRLRWNIFSIVMGSVCNLLFKLILNKLCYNFDHVKRRGLLSVFDFFLLQLAILAGVVLAITRLGILFFALFISVMRIDVMAIPEWFANILYIDSFNKSYYSSILVQHYHNNPIMITFYELMFLWTKPVNADVKIEDETKEKLNKRKIIRNRLHLWVFLSKNPSLVKYRVKASDESSEEDINHNGEDIDHNGEDSDPNGEGVADLEEAKTLEKYQYQENINGNHTLKENLIPAQSEDIRDEEIGEDEKFEEYRNSEEVNVEEVAEGYISTPKFNKKINGSLSSESLEERKE